jgi:hypothetical protein
MAAANTEAARARVAITRAMRCACERKDTQSSGTEHRAAERWSHSVEHEHESQPRDIGMTVLSPHHSHAYGACHLQVK